MTYFTNKVVAITGGSDGIGKALVDALLEKGAKVATCGRNTDKLYSLQLQNAAFPLHAVTCDVSREADCRHFIDSTLQTFGHIDILINNAGLGMHNLFLNTPIDELKQVMDVNFWGTVYCTRYALPSILHQKGTIVGMSSVAGYRGIPGRSGYSASKFALQGWLEALRVEMLDQQVHVMWVCPGFNMAGLKTTGIPEQGNGESALDTERAMTAEEVARITLKAIEKKQRHVIMTFTGKRTVFSTRFLPRLADRLIHKYFFRKGELIK